LNVVLSFSGQANIDEDDDDDIQLKIVMELMTIRMTTKKKKIPTNYQNTKV
jgi:hypothetical protein